MKRPRSKKMVTVYSVSHCDIDRAHGDSSHSKEHFVPSCLSTRSKSVTVYSIADNTLKQAEITLKPAEIDELRTSIESKLATMERELAERRGWYSSIVALARKARARSERRVQLPPGDWLIRFAGMAFGSKTTERVFKQAWAEDVEDWLKAECEGRYGLARWIRVRACARLVMIGVLMVPERVFKAMRPDTN